MLLENGVLKSVNDEEIVNGIFLVPDGVVEIGKCAFCNCKSLEEIKLPESVAVIRYGAFGDCSNLKKKRLYCLKI